MLTLTENLAAQDAAAEHKVHGASRPFNYFIAAMLAGAFIGLADIFMMTGGGPLKVAGSPWYNLIGGGVFGIGLILVVFAGGELATSAMMILPIGVRRHRISPSRALVTFGYMLAGNLAGSIVIAGLVRGSGIMHGDGPVAQALAMTVAGKVHHTTTELFFRGILCNILVCLAMWCVTRCSNEVAKIILMAWCMSAFVGSGFEHVVANMTTFSLGIMHGVDGGTFAEAGRNLLTVLCGNIVGGAIFVGGAYMLAARTEEHTKP
ncbi:formate/nitrite transporter family protein [Actinomyces vulturis]|uniref:formate/nitrite transporter family protein n=1 Tax=Actinomyces vulturis TaxID=1857645 RepID=UPI00082A7BF5|nr:formate/nitrite transporter family protein [Actinomyces vulturis]